MASAIKRKKTTGSFLFRMIRCAQASSGKQQAASSKQQAASSKQQAASRKPQAASRKPQAASRRSEALLTLLLDARRCFQGAYGKSRLC
jgi:hypothetical protein